MEDTNQVDVTTEQTQDTTQKVEEQQTEKIFKQEDVNNIVARESKSAQEKLLKELGVEDFENAKDGLAKFKEWQDEQKTAEEKTQEVIESLTKNNGDLESENKNLKATIEALKLGVNADSLDDVILLANKNVSEEVTIGEAIKGVLEKYPQFGKVEEENKTPKFVNKTDNKAGVGDEDIVDKVLKNFNYR